MSNSVSKLVVIVPAAGIGSRMQADRPKQYLPLMGKTVLEQTLARLASHPRITDIVLAVAPDDPYIDAITMPDGAHIHRVDGGAERADSVLNGLALALTLGCQWVLVHDAARPCVALNDIDTLIQTVLAQQPVVGGILAHPVRDTMKQATADEQISHTLDRSQMWHAMTPQMFPAQCLHDALQQALAEGQCITDEASAIEWLGMHPQLVKGCSSNIKITHPEDLALAAFYLNRKIT